jgi:hypothetical protein
MAPQMMKLPCLHVIIMQREHEVNKNMDSPIRRLVMDVFKTADQDEEWDMYY